MNILIQNKELKEKINELLNGEEKIQVNEITSEINLRKTYGNRDVINDTTFGLLYDKKIFGFFSDKKLSLKKLIKTREFLNKENLELNIKNYLLSLSKKRIESKYEEDKNEFEVSKIFYVVALFIIVISFYGHYAGWSYSFWNENDFLTFLNVIGTLILVGSIFIFFDLTLNLNYYNKINNLKKSYFMEISTLVALIFLGGIYFYFKETKNIGYTKEYEKGTSYSQPQPQQEVATQSVVGNKDVNRYIPTVEDARSINYKMYYNDYFDYSIDYPDDEYFEITKTYEDGMKLQNDNGEVLISLTSNWNPNGESLQQAYDKAVREKPNAAYKFLGKTFFTITYEDNGLLIFRKTMYDKNTNKYVYLYVSFPPEYKDYMTPIVERMANSMKKSSSTQNNTILSNVIYKTYYNDYYGYSIDYPISEDLYTSSRDNEGMEIKSYDDNVYISAVYGYDDYGDNLQQAYNRAVSEYPNAPYKFLGKTFFTITYEENGLLVFRKTVYDKINNGYIYLYVSFPPEYKEYMSPIVEKMANTMKKR